MNEMDQVPVCREFTLEEREREQTNIMGYLVKVL